VLAIVNFRVANHPQIAGSFSQHDGQNVFLDFLELAENLAFCGTWSDGFSQAMDEGDHAFGELLPGQTHHHSLIHSVGVLYATGNNVRVVGDNVRRALSCYLDAKMERPELRKFKFDPVERV
jgi:hypothetical protein